MRKQLQLVDLDHPTRIGRPLVRDEYHFGQPNMASTVVVRIIYFSLDFNHWKSHSSVVKGKSLASSCNSSLGQLHGRATAVTAASRRRQDLWRTNRAGLACPFFLYFFNDRHLPEKGDKAGHTHTHRRWRKQITMEPIPSCCVCVYSPRSDCPAGQRFFLFTHSFINFFWLEKIK